MQCNYVLIVSGSLVSGIHISGNRASWNHIGVNGISGNSVSGHCIRGFPLVHIAAMVFSHGHSNMYSVALEVSFS